MDWVICMNKRLAAALVVSGVILAGWMGSSSYGGYQAKQGIEALIDQPPSTTPLRFSNLKHQQGLFTSSGSVILHYPDPNAHQQPRPDLFQMEITYALDHRVTFNRMLQFDWTATLIGKGAQTMLETFNQNPTLSGQGQWDWDGLAQSDYTIPALRAEQDGDVLEMAAITGQLKVQHAQLWFDLVMPVLAVVDENGPLALNNIALTLYTKDRFTGEGRSDFSIEQIDFTNGQAQSFRVVGENSFSGDRLNVSIKKSIARLTLAGTTISDIALDLMLNDLYAQSVASMSAVMNVAGNLDNLTAAQQKVVQIAIRDLFVKGFSVGITKLSAKTQTGAATGSAVVRVAPAADTTAPYQFNAAKQLVVDAELVLSGQAIAPPITALGTLFGVIVPRENGFSGSLSLEQGELTVNGAKVPFTDEINQVSAIITELLQNP